MRVGPYTLGSLVHVIKRGARGMPIVNDDEDRWRFVRSLYLLNDEYSDTNWHRDTATLQIFERPAHWPERKPIVRVLSWTLLSNHFHLLLQETEDGGISRFMQRVGGSMSLCFNLKYRSQGSIFQSAYKGRTVDKDAYLRSLVSYLLVKNVFEMYPGGIRKAMREFDTAWNWATTYPFSALPHYVSGKNTPIVDDSDKLIMNIISNERVFKKEARDTLRRLAETDGGDLKSLMLEPW